MGQYHLVKTTSIQYLVKIISKQHWVTKVPLMIIDMEYLQTVFNSFSNHSAEKFKTPPTIPATHETVRQDVPINSLELQLTPIRDYIRCLEYQLNQAMKKIKNP